MPGQIDQDGLNQSLNKSLLHNGLQRIYQLRPLLHSHLRHGQLLPADR